MGICKSLNALRRNSVGSVMLFVVMGVAVWVKKNSILDHENCSSQRKLCMADWLVASGENMVLLQNVHGSSQA